MNKEEYENRINDFLKKCKLTPETKKIFTEIADFIFKTCVLKKKISFGSKKTENNVSELLNSRRFWGSFRGSVKKITKKKYTKEITEEGINVFDFLEKVGNMLKKTEEKPKRSKAGETGENECIHTKINNLMNDLNGANTRINNLMNDLNGVNAEIRFLDGEYQNLEKTVATWIQYNYETDFGKDLAERLNIKFVSEEENSGFLKEELFIYSENKGKDRPAIVRLNIKGEMKIIVQGMKFKN